MYNKFAKFYSEIMSNTADYEKVYNRYHHIITENNPPGNILLDLGCGSGELSRRFSKDFDVIGADISEELLSIAMSKSSNVQYIKQDARKLDLYGTVDVTIAVFDVLNHFNSIEDLTAVIEKVALFTAPGGLFVFDYNTIHKHQKILADNIFTYDYDDFYCIWANHCKNNTVTMNITIFEKAGKSYRRFDETITETAFEPAIVTAKLQDCGFAVTTEESEDRILFINKKLS